MWLSQHSCLNCLAGCLSATERITCDNGQQSKSTVQPGKQGKGKMQRHKVGVQLLQFGFNLGFVVSANVTKLYNFNNMMIIVKFRQGHILMQLMCFGVRRAAGV